MKKTIKKKLVVIDKNQKEIERKLKVSEEIYRRLFETARDGILILDSTTGEIKDVNPFLIQLLGYSKKKFLGKRLWEVGAFKNTTASKETFKLLQETGYARYDNLPLETSDGRLIEVEFISNAYMAGDERVMQCNIRDISERKRSEVAEKALVLLEQEKLKTRFIADATHELRTPLAIIKGNVELALRNKDKKASSAETFKAINVEVNHLAELLSDLTTLTTENQSLHQKISKSKINLPELIMTVGERCKKLALTKNVKIEVKNIPETFLVGDSMYLEKLFLNIFTNAIKYGKEKGLVTISARKNKKYATITVADNGIGIAKKDLPNIFNRFYRAENAKIFHHDGTGLGLAISKWIVEAHNGSIEVTSELKKGTIFTIQLPIFA
jgi:PAS domain S-box-containing protein